MVLNYIEKTGQMTRVGVIVPTATVSAAEEAACRFAMEQLQTDTTPMHTDPYPWGWEVVFETAYL
jgi:hypothetical protein